MSYGVGRDPGAPRPPWFRVVENSGEPSPVRWRNNIHRSGRSVLRDPGSTPGGRRIDFIEPGKGFGPWTATIAPTGKVAFAASPRPSRGSRRRQLPSFFGLYSSPTRTTRCTIRPRSSATSTTQYVSGLKRLELAVAGHAGRVPRPARRRPRDLRGGLLDEPLALPPRSTRPWRPRSSSTARRSTAGSTTRAGPRCRPRLTANLERPQRPPVAHRPDGHRHAGPRRSRPGSARTDSRPSPTTSPPSATASRRSPPNSGYHFEDPSLYYTQHLRGFFRGWGVQKVEAQAKLQSDLRTIQGEARAGPAGGAVLHRDVQILQGLGAAVPSTTMNAVQRDLRGGVRPGCADTPPTLAAPIEPRDHPGPAGTASRIASVDRLVADAPAFYQAAGAVGVQYPDDRRRCRHARECRRRRAAEPVQGDDPARSPTQAGRLTIRPGRAPLAASSAAVGHPLELGLVDDRDAELPGLLELAAGLLAGQDVAGRSSRPSR